VQATATALYWNPEVSMIKACYLDHSFTTIVNGIKTISMDSVKNGIKPFSSMKNIL
jgi:hypothetical protein